jgi:uncharacterized iron-regulated membrane protein
MSRAGLRELWVNVHLWLGLTLGALGVFIGITGSILVYDNDIDACLNPQRYAVSGPKVALPYGEYVRRAAQALEGRARPLNVRMPEEEGMPLVVLARDREGGFTRVYMDPPTGRVLDTAPGGGFIGWVHRFHENLTLREYMGREIVGLVGFAMLISSLSGIYLWWPGRGRFRESLGTRPGIASSRNLHYLCGFYGSLVLAMLSFTGIFLAYQDGGRAVVGMFSQVTAPPRNIQAPDAPREGKQLTLDEAIGKAQSLYPGAELAGFGLPAGPRGVYRVSLKGGGSSAPVSNTLVFVDPSSGEVLRRIDSSTRTAGDRFLVMQRLLHEGNVLGAAGRFVIFVVGFLPALLVVTGTMMWLRQRRKPRLLTAGVAAPATADNH